uniref:SAM-dependent MTase RsmB/NOP-type domain-containing protein n=1 Tax=Anopheles atroparvus TaxID=41427 RepID=A0AAG5DA15_ANOAO
MGRKVNFLEKPKKGPGRKARKQPEPVFKFIKEDDEDKKLSHRQKQRLVNRQQKQMQMQQQSEKKSNTKKAKPSAAVKSNESNTIDPAEIFDLEKSRQKYQQLGRKNVLPVGATTNGVKNGTAKKGRNLFDSDNEEDEETPKAKKAVGGLVKMSNMKKFLQQNDSEEDDSDEDEEMDSEEEVHGESDGDDESVEDEEDEDEEDEDDDDDDDEDEDDDDEDAEEDEDMLPIEAANKKLKKRMEREQKLADKEMEEAAANRELFQIPTEEELAQTTNLQDVNIRIKDVIGVLSDFSANRDPNRSRCEYIDLLRKDLCLYYSYNEYFMNLLMELFSPNELLEFLEASEVQRPITIRTNSLKTRRRDLAQALINRGINLDPIGKWSKDGLVVYSSQVPLGATPEYLAGHYMLQGASSMLPVMALAPEENERILDMCAAPGGKSSHIAALMKNTGVLFVNDSNRDRLHAVLGNFHRLGIQNAIITHMDGTKFNDVMKGFDRVLLDAPCTGSGVISKDPSVKTTKTEADVQRCYNTQRRLILTAIDCLSASSETGGYLVYSTCSVLPQENEWVINYALQKRNVRLVPTGIDFGVEGLTNFGSQRYHTSMKLTRRFYPHTHNMDGFFVAKLQKFSDAIPKSVADDPAEDDEAAEAGEAADDEVKLPKKIDKRDWYYKEILEKRKAAREDKNHVVTVFQKATNTKTKKKKANKPEDDSGAKATAGEKQKNKPDSTGAKMNGSKKITLTKAERKDVEERLQFTKKMKQLQQKITNGSTGSRSPSAPGSKKAQNGNQKKPDGQNKANGASKPGQASKQSKEKKGPGVKKTTFKKKVGKAGKAK